MYFVHEDSLRVRNVGFKYATLVVLFFWVGKYVISGVVVFFWGGGVGTKVNPIIHLSK